VFKGRWHYLEHLWWAEEGSYAFEPPGDIHTLEVPDDVEEMATMFHVTGAYIYVDVDEYCRGRRRLQQDPENQGVL
jgi:2,4'-dihydroxyacetophenone dioxygenase